MSLWIRTFVALLWSAPVAAIAADLPVKAPPPVAVYNWTGFYVGGNVGYSWGRATTSQTDTMSGSTTFSAFSATTGLPVTTVPGFTQTFPFTVPAATILGATNGNSNVNGIIGGLQGGYNWQMDRAWLWGLETDFQGSGERGSTTVCTVTCAVGNAIGTASTNLRWFGTLRGRIGYLPTPTLVLYATGGLAYGQLNTDYSSGIIDTNTPLATGSARSLRAGFTVGAGAEGAIDRHWSWKAEYLYMDLGTVSTTINPGVFAATTPAVLIRDTNLVATVNSSNAAQVSTRFTDNIFRFGFNYRFDGGPVIARY